jgi:tRNA pseudouridine13 synthase
MTDRLAAINSLGVPNYFGEQRFGRDGGNIGLADVWASGKRLPRHKRSIAISTARSFLFNQILDARVRDSSWNRMLQGDVAILDGSGSVFDIDAVDEDIERRAIEMDIHPTAPLAGDGSVGYPVFDQHGEWMKAFAKGRVDPGTRSLRLRVSDLESDFDDDSMTLRFSLGRGAYATSVLREMVITKIS